MASNPLDPFAYAERFNPRSQPLPSQNEAVDPVTAEIRRQRDRDLTLNIQLSPGPDAVAKATRVARQADVPPAYVEGREAEVQRDLDTRRLMEIANRFPAIGQWAAANPRGAIAASDDHKSLGILGGAWERIKEFGRGIPGALQSGYNAAAQGLNDTYLSIDEFVASYANPNTAREVIDREQSTSRAFKARADAAWPQSDSFTVNAALQGVRSIPTSLTAMAVGLLTRSPNAAAATMGVTTGAPAYRVALDKGLSRGEALQYGFEQGAVEALTERMPAGEWLNALTKRTPFGRAIVNTLAEEMPGEQVATALQDLSDWAHLNPDKPFSAYLAERPDAALATAIATITGTGAQVGASSLAVKAADHSLRVTAKIADRYQAARDAGQQRSFFDAAEKAALGSKLRARDPEAYASAVASMARDAGVEFAYIPATHAQPYMRQGAFS